MLVVTCAAVYRPFLFSPVIPLLSVAIGFDLRDVSCDLSLFSAHSAGELSSLTSAVDQEYYGVVSTECRSYSMRG